MKKLLTVLLLVSIAFTVPVKAEQPDGKTLASYALCGISVASAILAYTLFDAHKTETNKLRKIIQNTGVPLSYTNYEERAKNNFTRLTGGYAAGLLSFSTAAAGLALLAYKRFMVTH